ncbi:hypothetical protein HMPREF9069_00841 [Atopobium sp. oral taxon 810 str. F0209]|nr:hypothetical protein HMPREF9069_00841 [Atopobium sp. oral taxon 810 str. F0209]
MSTPLVSDCPCLLCSFKSISRGSTTLELKIRAFFTQKFKVQFSSQNVGNIIVQSSRLKFRILFIMKLTQYIYYSNKQIVFLQLVLNNVSPVQNAFLWQDIKLIRAIFKKDKIVLAFLLVLGNNYFR